MYKALLFYTIAGLFPDGAVRKDRTTCNPTTGIWHDQISPRYQRWIMRNSYDTNNKLRYARMVHWKLEPLLPLLSTTVL
jgi:hypothetical protein